MNNTETKQLEIFKPYIPAVQAFVDKFIVGTSTMTASKISAEFNVVTPTCLLSGTEFITGFRLAIREGLIVGLEGAQRLGYKRAGSVLPKQMIISSEDWAKICTLLGLKSSDGVTELIDCLDRNAATFPTLIHKTC
jgi:hypothetical protein